MLATFVLLTFSAGPPFCLLSPNSAWKRRKRERREGERERERKRERERERESDQIFERESKNNKKQLKGNKGSK